MSRGSCSAFPLVNERWGLNIARIANAVYCHNFNEKITFLTIENKRVLELDGAEGEKFDGVSFSGQTKLAEIGGKSA